MLKLKSYTLEDNTTMYRQIINARKLFVKAQYLCFMKESTIWFCNKHPQQKFITVPTRSILRP